MSRAATPLLLFATLLTAGCAHSVRRAALVPHQQPTGRSGAPMAGGARHELAFGTPVAASARAPTEARGANAGIALPRWEATAAWRIRAGRDTDVGLTWDHGFEANSRDLADDQPHPDAGDVTGGGVEVHHSARVDPVFRVGITGKLQLYSIPFVEYRTCVDPLCAEPYTRVEEGRDLVPVVTAGVTPTWIVHESVAIFGGFALRNHPTVEKSDVERIDGDDDEVSAGPFTGVGSGGVEITLGGGARATAYVHQPIGGPVRYGPTLGFTLSVALGADGAAPSPSSPARSAGAVAAPPSPVSER